MGRLKSMAVLGDLAVWLHEQKLVTQTFWTSKLLDEIEVDMPKAGKITFDMGFL